MVEAFKRFLRNYANFNGRSTRSDFWLTILACFLIGFVLGFVLGIIGVDMMVSSVISGILGLALFIPSLAIEVRRLHDINKSGWWLLLALTGIGSIVLFVFYCLPSVDENNKYGARVE